MFILFPSDKILIQIMFQKVVKSGKSEKLSNLDQLFQLEYVPIYRESLMRSIFPYQFDA